MPIHAAQSYDTLTFTVTNTSFKVGGISYQEAGAQEVLDMEIGYSVTDSDLDVVNGSFTVAIQPDNGDSILDNNLIQPDVL